MKVDEGIRSQMSNMHLDGQVQQQQAGKSSGESEPGAKKRACTKGKSCKPECYCELPDDVMAYHEALMEAHPGSKDAHEEFLAQGGCDGLDDEDIAAAHHHAFAMHHGQGPMGHPAGMGHHPHMGPMGLPPGMGRRPYMGPMECPTPMGPMMSPYSHPAMMGMPPMFAFAHQHRMMKMWFKMMKNSKGKTGKQCRKRFRKGTDDKESTGEQQGKDAQPMEGDQTTESQNTESQTAADNSPQTSDSDQSGSDDDMIAPFMTMMMMPPWGMRGMGRFRRRMCKRAGRQCQHHKQGKSDSEKDSNDTHKSREQNRSPRMRRRCQFANKMCARKCKGMRNECRGQTNAATNDTTPVGQSATAPMEEEK